MNVLSRSSLHAVLIAGSVTLAAFATTARAQEATPFDSSAAPSSITRTEARADRVLGSGEATEFVIDASPATRTRADVVAEAREAQRRGQLGHGDVNPPAQQRLTASGGVI